jgi:site-specific DNA recombinase
MPGSNFAVGHSRRFRDARDRSGLRLCSLDGWRLVIRIDGAGRSTGGGLFSRGHVYKLLSNPIYVGGIAHKGQIYEGHHPPIVTQDLWDEVQQSLSDHLGAARTRENAPIV